MPKKTACEKCRHLKAIKVRIPDGNRASKKDAKLICTVRRMNVTGKAFIHCSEFKGRQGRPAK